MKLLLAILSSLALAYCAHAANLTLAWDANPVTDQVSSYKLYDKTGDTWVVVGTTPPVPAGTAPALTLTLKDVTPGVHQYAVVAVNEWGESVRSDTVTTPPPANKPTGLKVTVTVTVVIP